MDVQLDNCKSQRVTTNGKNYHIISETIQQTLVVNDTNQVHEENIINYLSYEYRKAAYIGLDGRFEQIIHTLRR